MNSPNIPRGPCTERKTPSMPCNETMKNMTLSLCKSKPSKKAKQHARKAVSNNHMYLAKPKTMRLVVPSNLCHRSQTIYPDICAVPNKSELYKQSLAHIKQSRMKLPTPFATGGFIIEKWLPSMETILQFSAPRSFSHPLVPKSVRFSSSHFMLFGSSSCGGGLGSSGFLQTPSRAQMRSVGGAAKSLSAFKIGWYSCRALMLYSKCGRSQLGVLPVPVPSKPISSKK